MSKTLNKIEFKDIVMQCLEECHKDYQENYDHDTEGNYVPYGDTYVSTGDYITEESEERATEEWKDRFDVDDFIRDYLCECVDFREKVWELVEEF